jgi:ribosome-associated protein
MTNSTVSKKDTQKLQRAIVDGLEDVKAHDIVVFDTEHLSALFERVIVASGTSNRQTKALASSVREAVREAGFPKPRVEGEANGEWIIVDCAQAVVHIMQPSFRQYYNLEELWGEKPVRIKLGAAKPVAALPKVKAESAKPTKSAPATLKRSSAARKGALELDPPKRARKTTAVPKRAASKSADGPASSKKPAARKGPVTGSPAVARKAVAGKVSASKSGSAPTRAKPAKTTARKG